MTIRLLCAYSTYPVNAIVTLDAATEAGLVAANIASTNLSGGVAYVAPAVPNQLSNAQVVKDGVGNVLGFADGSGKKLNVGAVVATMAGNFAVGGTVSASLGPNTVGTIQFTRTLKASPFTKSNIAGAVANAVNSLDYKIKSEDRPYSISFDYSNVVFSTPATPVQQVTPITTNEVARVWQLNPGYSNAASVYNSGGGTIADGETDITATGMLITELEGRAKSVRLISANMSRVNTRRVTGVTAVCPPALGDRKYDALFAVATPKGWNGVLQADVPVVPTSATSPGLLVSDKIPITPQARTDIPGGKFLLALRERAFYPANMSGSADQHTNPAKWPCPYFTHSGADWGVPGQGMYYGAGVKGDSLTAPFPGTPTPTANCPILGIIIEYEDGAMGWAWFGSSFFKNDLESLANKRGAGFIMEATIAASTPQRPIEFINGGQAGQTLDKALICASNVIPLLRPTHVVVEFANPNNFAMVTESIINTARNDANAIIALAEDYGARPILFNGWARNTSTLPCTAPYFDAAQDLLLKGYRTDMASRGYRVIDTYTGMSAGVSPDYAKMAGNGFAKDYIIAKAGDGLHVTRDGTTEVLTPAATTAIRAEAATYFAQLKG